jgi:hypothetical protein
MKVFLLTVAALLVLSLAGLEMVMSSLPDDPITPTEVRASAPDGPGSALPADAASAVCGTDGAFAPAGHHEGVSGS